MNATVSVIIPCYNGAKTIDRAISSVYEQDYPNIELIVVDDGSHDSSREKILAWREKFDQKARALRYIYQENQGLGGAVNTGLKAVTGDFLMLLDADDEYLDGAISERIAYFKEHPTCNVVRSNGWRIRKNQKFLFVYEESEIHRDDVFMALLRGETNNWAGSYMVRTKPLFSFYPDREIYLSRFGQNLQILLPLVYQSECGFINKPLMNYILQESSLSQTSDDKIAQQKALDNAEGFRDIREHMVNLIVKDDASQKWYLQNVNGAYWRSIMYIATQYKDKKLATTSISHIKKFERLTMQDRIAYYNTICPPVALVLRICNKLQRTLTADKE